MRFNVSYNGNGNTGGNTESSIHTYDVDNALTCNGFTRNYTIIYTYNGNGQDNNTEQVTSIFDGWASGADEEKEYDDCQSVRNLTSTNGATVTLYAQWISGSVTLPTPERTGFDFTGWYTSASGEIKIGNGDETYTPTESITLYAQWARTTSVQEIESTEFKIYPNPANDEIFIKSDLPIKKVEIYSITGVLLLFENNFNGKISISTLPQGVYMVKIDTDNDVITQKFVKE